MGLQSPLRCCSDLTQQLSSLLLPHHHPRHYLTSTSFKSFQSFLVVQWGLEIIGSRPPDPQLPLSSLIHSPWYPSWRGYCFPTCSPLHPSFPLPWVPCLFPVPPTLGNLSCLPLTHRPEGAVLPVGVLQLRPRSAHFGGSCKHKSFFCCLPIQCPAGFRLQLLLS